MRSAFAILHLGIFILWLFFAYICARKKTTTIKMKSRTVFCILFVLSFCCRMMAASGVYDVRDYGAKGDGTTLDHGAINKAIEAATADGGGQVVLPAGTYLCGSIRLNISPSAARTKRSAFPLLR